MTKIYSRRELLAWASALAGASGVAHTTRARQPANLPPTVAAALDYVAREHDRFHRHFLIFDDFGSGGGHFFPSMWMGDLVGLNPKAAGGVFDERAKIKPAEGQNCLQVNYSADLARFGAKGWVAVAWKGPPDGKTGKPLGYVLRRFVIGDEMPTLKWFMRGARGGERAEVKVHPSDPEMVPFVLKGEWEEYSRPVRPELLRAGPLTECFVWATNRQKQNPAGAIMYFDFARIEFGTKGTALRLAEPRFVRSYFPEPTDTPDQHFRNVCYSYDQALAISALVATGRPEDLRRAGLIADALVYATKHDRSFKDGRIRNGYLCGDVAGQGPEGPSGPTRLPGWWDIPTQQWFEDGYFAGSDSGNTAWVILGLLNYWQAAGRKPDSPHLAAAVKLGKWVIKIAHDVQGAGGFLGGMEGFEPIKKEDPPQKKSLWKSTEHAIDLYAAFARLESAVQNPDAKEQYRAMADHAEKFVGRMWNAADGHLWTGTTEDGLSINKSPIPLDIQPWAVLAFRDPKRFGPALDWANANCRVPLGGGLFGYDFDTDKDGTWFEGTGQMALAFRLAGRGKEADSCLQCIRETGVVTEKGEANGGVYAASKDELTTGFMKVWVEGGKPERWLYYHRPHIGASCWFVLAALGYNPYHGEFIDRK